MRARVGIGYDLHRFAPGRALKLGGVEIEHTEGLLGHSDADAVLHALCDALLGAAGIGDIGELYPDTEAAWKDADSRQFVIDVMKRVRVAGLQVCNADLVVHADRPRLGPHKLRMRESVAGLLGIDIECVTIKATSNEGLDAIGRGEALACWVAVLLESA